ncbi:MAG: DUF4893 domain-containing protein [Alphaproteobacteria bacterium]
MRAVRTVMIALAFATPALAQSWEDEISDFDRDRLAHLSEARAKGMAAAEAGASQAELAAIRSVMEPEGGDVGAASLKGNWRCRTIKLGGMAPAMVYDWFNCRIRDTRNGLYFEKRTGTQRLYGYLDEYDGRWLLLSSMAVGNDRPRPYSGGNRGAGAPTTHQDSVGVLTRIGPNRLRIEFPYPFYESRFDVMELRR